MRSSVALFLYCSIACALTACDKSGEVRPEPAPPAPAVSPAAAPSQQEGSKGQEGNPGETDAADEPSTHGQNARPAAGPGDQAAAPSPSAGDAPQSDSGATSAEKGQATGPEKAADGQDPRHVRSFPPLAGNEAQRRGCKVDADCTVSCRRDGRCCPELCGCSQVYNKRYAAGIEARILKYCHADVVCPVARCVGKKGGTATCRDNLCTLVGSEASSK